MRPVLIVEDDPDIAESLRYNLEREGLTARIAETGEKGLAAALDAKNPPALVILDLMLPGMSGTELCRRLRREPATRRTPIIMLTARVSESDRVAGFDLGADDYITKPFSVRELMARVRALLRRGPSKSAERQDDSARAVSYKHIAIDPLRRRVTVAGKDVELTSQEFQLLQLLLSNPGIVFSREALLRRVWKDDTFVTVRSVDTLVKRLRKKVEEDAADPAVIITVWGAGYKAADV